MQPERITAVLRPRADAEAADLGIHLARAWYGPLLLRWLLLVWPFAAAVAGLLRSTPGLALLAIWFAKPLYDRVVLHHMSRALFQAAPSLGASVRAWPRLLATGLGDALLLRRLSPFRSMLAPVRLLEGLRGERLWHRRRVLSRHSGKAAAATTVWFHIFEEIAVLAVVVLLSMLVPRALQPDWQRLAEDVFLGRAEGLSQAVGWTVVSAYVVTTTLLEPFYVGAGFGLYLNARVHLEGWDIDLAFRRMTRRLSAAATAAAVLAVAVVAPATAANGATGEPPDGPAAQETGGASSKAQQRIEHVLSDSDFDRTVTVERFKWKFSSSAPDWVSGAFQGVLRGLVLAVLVAAALGLLWLLWRYGPRPSGGRSVPDEAARPPPPRVVSGMDIRPESLPDDVPAAARSAWVAGRRTEAMSLLYRGALARLTHRHGVPIRSSDTEEDCLGRLQEGAIGDDLLGYMRRLVGAWVRCRYAQSLPADRDFEHLCGSWPF